jgi:hypothetical protein
MRKILLAVLVAAAFVLGASNAMAQCCGSASDGNNDCVGIPPGGTEGCQDLGNGTCAGGDANEGGAGPAGCACVAGTCICDSSGNPCPSAQACADAADAACES